MAGSASRIYNFCNSQPSPCACLQTCPNPTPPPNTKIEDFLITNNALSGAPFSICNYGNAFTGVETFAGEGDGKDGVPVNSDMYFRYASMTKTLGIIVLGAAMEDGYIDSLDDSVAKYVPEFSGATGTYVDPLSVTRDPGNAYDAYGTPIYTMTTIPFSLEVITIRHLVTMTAGFGYSFLGNGILRSVLNSLPEPSGDDLSSNGICNRNTYIAWLQSIEGNPIRADVIDHLNLSNVPITYTDAILNRITSIPFLFFPGTQCLYDICATVMGAVVGSALQQKGVNKTSTEYLQSRVFSPLNIKSIWFNCGASQPPANAQTNITDAYFVRNDTFIGAAGSPGPDPYINHTGKGVNVIENTLYRVSNPDALGDGFTNQCTIPFYQDFNGVATDPLAGGYDWSGCGTIPDFCKILKFLIKKGKNQRGIQVLKPQTIEWILAPKNPVGLSMWLYGNGSADFMYPSATWCGGFAKFMSNSPSLPFPCGPNTYYWQCYFGFHFYFDTETGNYMVSGTQCPVTSWYVQDNYLTVSPYGIYPSVNAAPHEPNDTITWKLSTTM
jgi:CubicO group peptidase (beta-lactamase class C family)